MWRYNGTNGLEQVFLMYSIDELTVEEYLLVQGICEGLKSQQFVGRTGWLDVEERFEVIFDKLGIAGTPEEQQKKLIEMVNAEKKS